MYVTLFPFMIRYHAIVWTYNVLVIHSSAYGHLHCFHFWPLQIMCGRMFCVDVCLPFSLVSIYLGVGLVVHA